MADKCRIRIDDDEVVTLCDDLIFQILLSVPAESLVKFQCVCKTWSVMINSPVFVESHHENKSDTLLVNQSRNWKLKEFCVLHLESTKYTSINGDNLRALDSLNGLVLAMTIDSRLLLVNPMTRKHIDLPKNYIKPWYNVYNLAFCVKSKTYKVVHLFRECTDLSYSCEILTIGARRWRTVDLPSVFKFQRCHRVQRLFFGESLYWAFYDDILGVMNVQDETFSIKNMTNLKFNYYCVYRLMEIGGNLGIVLGTVYTGNFEVWFSDKANEIWTKKYDIRSYASFREYDVEPICCSRDAKEIFFYHFSSNSIHQVYGYNLVKDEWRLICTLDYEGNALWGNIIPHRNTLVWWE